MIHVLPCQFNLMTSTRRCYAEAEIFPNLTPDLCDTFLHGNCERSIPAKILHRSGNIN